MTAAPGISTGVGFRYCQILALNSDDRTPLGASTTPYAGLQMTGANSLTLNVPDPRQIVARGDDRPFALFTLPPEELITGELMSSKANQTLIELLTGNKSVTIGESKFQWYGTDKAGFESQVCMLAYQVAQDTDPSSSNFGKEIYNFVLMPLVKLIPKPGSMNENVGQPAFVVRPTVARKYPWGLAFASGTEGNTEGQVAFGVAEGRPRLVAWVGNNSAVDFLFETAFQAYSTAKVKVYSNAGGSWADVTGSVTVATNKITYGSAPASGVRIVAWYETT